MSNVIDFLHTLGQDADLRHASRQQLELALEAAGIDPALRAALLGSDQRQLENLLGANTNVCAMIAPGKKEEDEDDEDFEDDDDEDEDEDDEDFEDDDEDDEDFDDDDDEDDEDEDEEDLDEEEDSLAARLCAAGRVA